jgi:hypothetical protein
MKRAVTGDTHTNACMKVAEKLKSQYSEVGEGKGRGEGYTEVEEEKGEGGVQ